MTVAGTRGPPDGSFWDANRARMLELRASGLSTSKIAAAIGATKNAVIGKLHRLGVCEPREYTPRQWFTPFPPRGCCVFPFGDPGGPGFGFCGAPVGAGEAYCARHRRLCHRGAISLADAVDDAERGPDE